MSADQLTAPIRVAIDVTSMFGPRTGVGHVTAAVVERLAAHDGVVLSAYAVTRRGASTFTHALPTGGFPDQLALRTTRVPGRMLFAAWARVSYPRIETWTGPVDVVHGTNFVVPPSRAASLVTIHDLTFAREPDLCTTDSRRFAGLVDAALARGAAVHVFSDAVAAQVRERFALPADRVVRVYPGVAPTGGGDPVAGRQRAGTDRYVLALGTVEPRKNLPRLVDAFDRIAGTRPDLGLVVAGPDGWGEDEFAAAVARAGAAGRVRRIGYLGDAERADVLAGATVLAYPSLDEGFGHPPLEAMRAGVPVVARAGALPEVLGDAALLVDPHDVEALAAALATTLDDAATRTRLVDAGRERVERYSWDRTVDELVDLYRRLAAQRPRAGIRK